VEERSERFASSAFGAAELAVLLEGTKPGARDRWLTAGWAAKEAVAKSRGSGLKGRPKSFPVTARDTTTLTVDGVPVRTALRDGVVVAWTDQTER